MLRNWSLLGGAGLLVTFGTLTYLSTRPMNRPTDNIASADLLVFRANGSAKQGSVVLGESQWMTYLEANVRREYSLGNEFVPSLAADNATNAKFIKRLEAKLGECGISDYYLRVYGHSHNALFSQITSGRMYDWRMATSEIYRDLLFRPSPVYKTTVKNGSEYLFVGVAIESGNAIDFRKIVESYSGRSSHISKVYFVLRLDATFPLEEIILHARNANAAYGTPVLLSITGMERDFGIDYEKGTE